MKTKHLSALLIFIFIQAITTQLFAQGKASATFFSENGEKFWVVLNGVKINTEAHYRVVASDLDQPAYKVKVIFQDQKLGTVDKNITTQNYDDNSYMDVVYGIRKNKKGEYVLRIASFDEADKVAKTEPVSSTPAEPAQTSSGSSPAGTNGAVTEQTVVTTTTTTNGTNGAEGVNVGMQVGGESMNINVNMGEMGMGNMQQQSSTTITTTTTTTSSSSVSENQTPPPAPKSTPPPAPKGCETAMSSADYASAKKSISGQSFSDSQMKVASQVVKANCLNVAQVRGIMDIFSYEEQKLEFAKMAYPKTVDKGNYYQLNDGFTYSSSTDELNSFLEEQ